jgi:hypothetical protein
MVDNKVFNRKRRPLEMVDDTQVTEFTGEVEGAPDTSEQNAEPQFVTADAVQAMLQEGFDGFGRQMQSQFDKRDTRSDVSELQTTVRESLEQNNATVETLRKLGVEIPDTVSTALAQQTLETAIAGTESQQPRNELPDQQQLADNPISIAGNAIARQYDLYEEDPEAANIRGDGTPEEYLASITAAGIAKQERVATQRGEAPQPDIGVPSRVPSGGQGKAPSGRPDLTQTPGTLIRDGIRAKIR